MAYPLPIFSRVDVSCRPHQGALRALVLAGLCVVGTLLVEPSPATAAPPKPAAKSDPAQPEETGYGDDDESGFGDDDDAGDSAGFADAPTTVTATVAVQSPWSLTGSLRSDWGAWTERFGQKPGSSGLKLQGGADNPFAKARQNVDLQLGYKRGAWRVQAAVHGEFDAAYRYRTSEYGQPTRDTYGQLLQIRESFVALALGAFEITVGRQVVAWGEGDGMSVVDVVNPRDNREPGLSDLEDIRIPVLASRIGWFTTTAGGDHRVEAMVVHETCNTLWRENCFGLRGPPMGPFSPLPALFKTPPGAAGDVNVGALLDQKALRYRHGQRDLAWANQQWLLRWVYKGAGVDLGLYAASVLDQQGVITDLDFFSLLDTTTAVFNMPLKHLRYELLGTSGAKAVGDFLLKWELAYQRRRPFNTGDGAALPPVLTYRRADTLQVMASVTWRGIRNTVIGFEGMRTTLLNALPDLLFPADAPTLSLRAQHTAWGERLHLTAVVVAVGSRAQYGWLARGDVTWDIRDALKLTASYVTYQPGQEFGPFSGLTRHDRAGLRLKWSFSAL